MKEFWEKVYKTLAFYQASALREARKVYFDQFYPKPERPVFVVGCSRAGTTLVYKTLSESSRLGTLQRESHDFWADLHPTEERGWESHAIPAEFATDADRQAVGRLFFSHTGKRRFVDKNNQNGLSIPYLQRLFPDAIFVYVKRNPGDNIHSLIEGWKKSDVFATWSEQLPAKVNIEGGLFKRWCFFLPEGWRGYLDASIEEVCAFQYRAMNTAILDAGKTVPPAQWCEVRYEDILSDPVGTFAEVFEHCGLPFDTKLRRHCAGVLQKPYNAFSRIGTDKWKSTPNRLKIEKVLQTQRDISHRMGYA